MRIHKRPIGVFILLLVAILSLTLVNGIGRQYQDTSSVGKRDDATPIQEGRMTDKQREHSKLYKGFGAGRKLKDLSAENPGGVKVKRNRPLPVGESVISPTLPEFLKGLACKADAVVIGGLAEKSSQLTDDGEFVFTDYDLSIEDVLKDNVFSHLMPGVNLTLTQPGGRVLLNGRLIEAVDASFQPLLVGHRYLLFLKFIPSTRTYASLNSTSTYELSDNGVKVQTEEETPSALNNEKASNFIDKVRAVTGGDCLVKGGQ